MTLERIILLNSENSPLHSPIKTHSIELTSDVGVRGGGSFFLYLIPIAQQWAWKIVFFIKP